MAYLIVEHVFDPPLTDEEHNRAAARLDPCLEAHGAKWLSSFLSVDRCRMICQFEATDAEAVRASMRSADVKFERVWPSEIYQLGKPVAK